MVVAQDIVDAKTVEPYPHDRADAFAQALFTTEHELRSLRRLDPLGGPQGQAVEDELRIVQKAVRVIDSRTGLASHQTDRLTEDVGRARLDSSKAHAR